MAGRNIFCSYETTLEKGIKRVLSLPNCKRLKRKCVLIKRHDEVHKGLLSYLKKKIKETNICYRL